MTQPYNTPAGNSRGSAFVAEAPLTASQAAGVQLRWSLSNISKLLGPLDPDLAGQFKAFGAPLSPSSETMIMLASRPVENCYNGRYSCSVCHLVRVDVRTGQARTLSPHNVSFGVDDPVASCLTETMGVWAFDANVYVGPPDDFYTVLDAYDPVALTRRWRLSFAVDKHCPDLYAGPLTVVENRDGSTVYVVTACAVHAVSAATGALRWLLPLPLKGPSDNDYAASSAALWAPATNAPRDTLLVLSYTARQNTFATVGIDLASGGIIWTQPYYPGNTAEGTDLPGPSMGGGQYVFAEPVTDFQLGVAAIDVRQGGKLVWQYASGGHSLVWSNVASSPDNVSVFTYGDDTDWANPIYLVDARGKARSLWVNGTDDFSAAECPNLFLLGPHGAATAMYAFCDGSRVFAIDVDGLTTLWSLRLTGRAPDGYWTTNMYLGNGTFVVDYDNRDAPDHTWLRVLHVYF